MVKWNASRSLRFVGTAILLFTTLGSFLLDVQYAGYGGGKWEQGGEGASETEMKGVSLT